MECNSTVSYRPRTHNYNRVRALSSADNRELTNSLFKMKDNLKELWPEFDWSSYKHGMALY